MVWEGKIDMAAAKTIYDSRCGACHGQPPRFRVEGGPAGGLLAVPLRFFDDLAAGLVVSCAPGRTVEAGAEKWLDLLAGQAALLVQNSRVFDEWRETRDRLAEIARDAAPGE